jgi:hypothetical protein
MIDRCGLPLNLTFALWGCAAAPAPLPSGAPVALPSSSNGQPQLSSAELEAANLKLLHAAAAKEVEWNERQIAVHAGVVCCCCVNLKSPGFSLGP